MTYCVGLLVDTGLVMMSDSRTNAGIDQINTFRKMATFVRAKERVLVLMSAGNLAITQAVINLLQEKPEDPTLQERIYRASNMFNAARVVGDALREIHQRDGEDMKEHGHEFNRVITRSSSLAQAAKCALVSMDSTIRSNLSVGPPLDLAIIRRDEFALHTHISINMDNEYFTMIRTRWGVALQEVFSELPNPEW